jgi:DNA-binding response OmpR family regulator
VFRQQAYHVTDGATPDAAAAEGGKHNLGLTAREFELLHMLLRDVGNIVPRRNIIDSIWGNAANLGNDGSRTLDRHVSTLRKKLPAPVGSIKSTPRIGYQFLTVSS